MGPGVASASPWATAAAAVGPGGGRKVVGGRLGVDMDWVGTHQDTVSSPKGLYKAPNIIQRHKMLHKA